MSKTERPGNDEAEHHGRELVEFALAVALSANVAAAVAEIARFNGQGHS